MSQLDLEATLNCGVGMVAVSDPASIDASLSLLDGFGIRAWVVGEVDVDPDQDATVRLVGQHPDW